MENRTVIIDTNVLIEHLRSKNRSDTLFTKALSKFNVITTIITEYELYDGAYSPQHEQDLIEIFALIDTLPFERSCGELAVKIKRELQIQQKSIGIRDLFIAAITCFHNLPLLTRNSKHFSGVKNLELINPEALD